ncbi:MAG: antibiotic biosynthesis monooxygenase [Proteobacteria bacterium]|nr:antibiotic biosynthesis monooxygenase [Pseudomonadota bacterium]
MFLRLTVFKVKQGKMDELRQLYIKVVMPAHKNHKGNRFVHLLERVDEKDQGISITAWDSRVDAEAYEKSGDYEKILGHFNELFQGSTRLESYEVTASSEPLLLRIF